MAGIATKVDGQLAACDVLPSQAIFSSFKPQKQGKIVSSHANKPLLVFLHSVGLFDNCQIGYEVKQCHERLTAD
jgi:hypothetical protein